MLLGDSVALDRMVDVASKSYKDRQMSMLPPDVLSRMVIPPQSSRLQYSEAAYLWARCQGSLNAIPVNDRTSADYDVMMYIVKQLSLLQPYEWKLKDEAESLIAAMKQQGLKPL
ncbi:hypothetical protein BGX27_007948 [Mortierella sp. AM989]|nr:hypothetical protein BGX27_007948 [Mortierella sp. AM989]